MYLNLSIYWNTVEKKQTIILNDENCKNGYAKDKACNQEIDLLVVLLNFASITRPKQWRVSVFAKFGVIIYTCWFRASLPRVFNFKTCNLAEEQLLDIIDMDFNILHRFDRPNEAANFVCKFLFWNWTITTEREFSSQKYGKRNIYGDICIYFPTGSKNIQFCKSISTLSTQSILHLDAFFSSLNCFNMMYIIQLIHHF